MRADWEAQELAPEAFEKRRQRRTGIIALSCPTEPGWSVFSCR